MTDLPDPLTPPNCDLRDFQFMPLEIRRLLTSETWVLCAPAEKVAAFTLWCESWHQTPAASTPGDDRMLAHLSGAGAAWRKVRQMALRGWVKCSDGRLYHPTVAEIALEAWIEKLIQRRKGAAGNSKRWGGDCDLTTINADIEVAVRLLRRLNPDSKHIAKAHRNSSPGDPTGTPDDADYGSPGDRPGIPQGDAQGIPVGSQGTGTGTGNKDSSLRSESPPSATDASHPPQSPPAGGAGPARSKNEGARIPDDWTLTAALIAYAASCGYSEHEARFIAHRFTNHWRAATGPRARKRDWSRAFMVWVTNEDRRRVQEGAKAWRGNGAANETDQRAERERAWREHGFWDARWGERPDAA